MDWTHVLTVILSVIGINLIFFIYLMNRMDNAFKTIENRLSKIEQDLLWIKFHYGHKPEDDLKEN